MVPHFIGNNKLAGSIPLIGKARLCLRHSVRTHGSFPGLGLDSTTGGFYQAHPLTLASITHDVQAVGSVGSKQPHSEVGDGGGFPMVIQIIKNKTKEKACRPF